MLHDYKPTNDKALLSDLIFYNPKIGPKQVLCLIGLKKVLAVTNTRELRALFPSYTQRSWQRLITEASKIQLPVAHSPL